MIWKNIKLRNELKKLVSKNKDVEDIVLFGSTVRGKIKPTDTDIIVIFKLVVDKNVEYKIRKLLELYLNKISIISKTRNSLFDESFDARESIILEGISLLSGKSLSNNYGLDSLELFKYDFKGWDKLKKTKFYHTVNGRMGKEGLIKRLGCIKISDRLILVPLNKAEEIKEFLESWEIKYITIPILIPQRLNKKSILE